MLKHRAGREDRYAVDLARYASPAVAGCYLSERDLTSIAIELAELFLFAQHASLRNLSGWNVETGKYPACELQQFLIGALEGWNFLLSHVLHKVGAAVEPAADKHRFSPKADHIGFRVKLRPRAEPETQDLCSNRLQSRRLRGVGKVLRRCSLSERGGEAEE